MHLVARPMLKMYNTSVIFYVRRIGLYLYKYRFILKGLASVDKI